MLFEVALAELTVTLWSVAAKVTIFILCHVEMSI